MILEKEILITGGNGRLGKAFKSIIPKALYPTSKEMDIKDFNSVFNYFEKHKPKYVIHLAAKTSIIDCEKDKKDAMRVNVSGTSYMVGVAELNGTKLFIYLNTACIFSGDDGVEFYDEDSIPNPKHFYGLTKLLAEHHVMYHNSDEMQTISIRTNFTSMPWEYPKAFTDRYSTYLFVKDVAKAILEIVEEKPDYRIIHITGDKKISMYDYAIAGGSKVEPITMKDFKNKDVKLTQNMCLTSNCWKLYKLTNKS